MTGSRENIHVAAALTESKDNVIVNVINTGLATSAEVAVGEGWTVAGVRAIAAPKLINKNTEEKPDTVHPATVDAKIVGGSLLVETPAYCISEVTLSKAQK